MTARRARSQSGNPAEIQLTIGYRFADNNLLVEALTHASTLAAGRRHNRGKPKTRSNERLEFLGDRVLGLAVAHLLIETYPGEAEGGLTHRHSMLVRRDTLAAVATEIDLGRWLDVAHGGRGSGGIDNPTILADACEALIGAIFLDGGYAAAVDFVHRHWRARVLDMTESPRDSKTMLQVWALARGHTLPSYRVVETAGPPHAPVFTIEVRIEGLGAASAEAGAKRTAEQAAAATLLERLESSSDG